MSDGRSMQSDIKDVESFLGPRSVSKLPYSWFFPEVGIFRQRDGSLGVLFEVIPLDSTPLSVEKVTTALGAPWSDALIPSNCVLQVLFEQDMIEETKERDQKIFVSIRKVPSKLLKGRRDLQAFQGFYEGQESEEKVYRREVREFLKMIARFRANSRVPLKQLTDQNLTEFLKRSLSESAKREGKVTRTFSFKASPRLVKPESLTELLELPFSMKLSLNYVFEPYSRPMGGPHPGGHWMEFSVTSVVEASGPVELEKRALRVVQAIGEKLPCEVTLEGQDFELEHLPLNYTPVLKKKELNLTPRPKEESLVFFVRCLPGRPGGYVGGRRAFDRMVRVFHHDRALPLNPFYGSYDAEKVEFLTRFWTKSIQLSLPPSWKIDRTYPEVIATAVRTVASRKSKMFESARGQPSVPIQVGVREIVEEISDLLTGAFHDVPDLTIERVLQGLMPFHGNGVYASAMSPPIGVPPPPLKSIVVYDLRLVFGHPVLAPLMTMIVLEDIKRICKAPENIGRGATFAVDESVIGDRGTMADLCTSIRGLGLRVIPLPTKKPTVLRTLTR